MALWEYKVITSGQHGFATPALLEAHLNALGKDEWEIIHFQTLPNNPLAFNGLVRRSTTRDWTPPVIVQQQAPAPSRHPSPSEDVPPPARPQSPAPAAAETVAEEKTPADDKAPVREETLRPMRNTERDLDPEADEDEEDWDNWEEAEDELPTFFEAIKPHLRRNQKGPGMSVAVDFLAKRWDLRESDVVSALKECGFTLPETEEADPDYFEFEGDLYWINRNNRGQLFINTREKPRPVFRTAPAQKLSPDDPATAELVAERAAEKAEIERRNQERLQREAERQAAAQARAEAQAAARAAREAARAAQGETAPEAAPAEGAEAEAPAAEGPQSDSPSPTGDDLLDKIRPHMRRNRRGPGYSGSTHFLSRALKCSEKSLIEAFAALGLQASANPNDKPTQVEIGNAIFWMNRDGRGGLWINGRESRGSKAPAAAAAPTTGDAAPAADGANSAAEPAAPTSVEASGSPAPAESPAPASEPSDLPPPLPTVQAEAPQTPAVEAVAEDAPAEEPAADEADDKGDAKPKKRPARPRSRKKAEPEAGA
ncbi:hypothetical protein [Nibricoccus sp. IMCC34717]|uniref:hypothetical protein n=1 Tax=Nibricoccus sp. IMCC34717 TaxID=3034021 RepID=UPI003850FAB3